MKQVTTEVVLKVLAAQEPPLELAGLSVDRIAPLLEEAGILDAEDKLHFAGRAPDTGNYCFCPAGEAFSNAGVAESLEDAVTEWEAPAKKDDKKSAGAKEPEKKEAEKKDAGSFSK